MARYALDRDLVLVTANMVDFQKIYIERKLHPGLIFLGCDVEEIFTGENQITLFDAALDELLENDLLQEFIYIKLTADHGDELEWDVSRHELPNHLD